MRERLVALKLQRDQIAKQIGELQNRMAGSAPTITPEKVAQVAGLLRDKLYEGPPEFRQAYARLLMDEVSVTDEEIRINGPKSVLARSAANGVGEPAPKVLSFVQEWRARRDSNSQPSVPKTDALSVELRAPRGRPSMKRRRLGSAMGITQRYSSSMRAALASRPKQRRNRVSIRFSIFWSGRTERRSQCDVASPGRKDPAQRGDRACPHGRAADDHALGGGR